MNATIQLTTRMANNMVTRTLAYHVDRLFGSHVLEPFYKKHLFQSTPNQQTNSPLRKLPTEIRLMIYEHVFSPPYTPKNIHAILATCRLIYIEAAVLAMKKTRCHKNGHKVLSFQSELWALGDLKQHLRHVEITMPMEKLDPSSADNPFILTTLPLDILIIDFETIDVGNWLSQNRLYHRLISALLYRKAPATVSDSDTTPVHKTLVSKNKRRVAAVMLEVWATKTQLYSFLLGMQTKKLVLKAKADDKDVIWSAFTHFDLVHHPLTVLRTSAGIGKRKEFHMMFGTDEGVSFLEMGRGLPMHDKN